MEGWRTGEACNRVILHFDLPKSLTRLYIHRMFVGSGITEERHVLTVHLGDLDPIAHQRPAAVRPVDATRSRIQRIHVAGIAAHKQPPSHYRWLRGCDGSVGKAKCPLQPELAHILCLESRIRLITRIALIDTPAIPVTRLRSKLRRRLRAHTSHGHARYRSELFSGQEPRYVVAFLVGKA